MAGCVLMYEGFGRALLCMDVLLMSFCASPFVCRARHTPAHHTSSHPHTTKPPLR